MAILITGGAGYIGSHMVHELADRGEQPVVIDDFSSGFEWAIPSGVPVFVEDIGDQRRGAPLLAKYGISEIIHFAASVVVPESVADPLRYYRNNTANSRSLFEVAITSGVQRFIFSSTAAVYGNPPANPVTEETPVAPVSPYGSSKFMAETMLRDAARAYGLRYIILRYFNVAGADPALRTAQATRGATHLIKVAAETAWVCERRCRFSAPIIPRLTGPAFATIYVGLQVGPLPTRWRLPMRKISIALVTGAGVLFANSAMA